MGCAGFSSLKTVKKNPETEAIPFQDFVFAEDNLFSCDISHKSCYPTGQYDVETYVGMFEEALSQQARLEEYRLYGELLMANLHALQRGMQAAKVVDFYSETQELRMIPLDERFSPQENAQRYFKKYKKGKAAKALAVQQREETLEEIAYLEGQQDNLNKCSTDDELSEIREELERRKNDTLICIGNHEQYFFPDYFNYEPDYADRIYEMAKILLEEERRESIFIEDIVNLT